MSMHPITATVDYAPGPAPVGDPSASPDALDLSVPREPHGAAPPIVQCEAAVLSESPPHRRHAAAMIRQLGVRTDAALRRELDRFFAVRPGLSHADRAEIARAMSRFRNQLLHRPRSTLRAAAGADGHAGPHPLFDAVRRLFGLSDVSHSSQAVQRAPGDRPARLPARSMTS